MKRQKLVLIAAVCVPLGACSGLLQGALGGGSGNLIGEAENLIPELILQKYQGLHNLKVGMQAIDATPGPVTMTMPAPMITPAR